MDLIEDLTEKSHGGICGNMIQVVDCNFNHVIPDVILDKITGTINLSGSMEWQNVFGQEDTFHFTESPIEVQGTTMYQSQLTAIISKDKISRLRSIDKLMRIGHMIKFTDSNHITKLMGAVRRGTYLSWSRDNKATLPEANSIQVTWAWTNQRPVPELVE